MRTVRSAVSSLVDGGARDDGGPSSPELAPERLSRSAASAVAAPAGCWNTGTGAAEFCRFQQGSHPGARRPALLSALRERSAQDAQPTNHVASQPRSMSDFKPSELDMQLNVKSVRLPALAWPPWLNSG